MATQLSSRAWIADRGALAAPRRSCSGVRRQQRLQAHATTLLDTLLKPVLDIGERKPLKEGIANFYDESSQLWESMWGEHMHHGYYPKGSAPKTNQQAQIDMIEETLSWAGATSAEKVVDVGCGIGGSSRYLARKFGCTARGITLSPNQAARANQMAAAQGLGDACTFQVADALQQPFPDKEFDLVWSMESGEHMPDKPQFVSELARVCAPGGRVIVVTWCHRVLAPGEKELRPEEQSLLDRICEAYYLPTWCSVADYQRLFEAEGLTDIKTADWSEEVAPFWGEVIKSAFTSEGISGLLKAGWTTIKGALVMPLMAQGFRMGLVKFVLITGRKPQARSRLVLALRLLMVLNPVTLANHWAAPVPLPSSGVLHVVGRLFLAARGFTLLACPLGFGLPPTHNAVVHVAATAAAWQHVRAPCTCAGLPASDCFLGLPEAQQTLAGLANGLSRLPTFFPLPWVELHPWHNPCLLLAHWLQICWLCVVPCVLVCRWEITARREFALTLPHDALPPAERACMLAGDGRACTKAGLLLALHCVPLFDWHAWQQLCRTRVSCLTLFKVMLWLLLTTNGRGCSNAIVPTAPPKDACSLPGGAASCGAPWRSATAHGAAAGSQPAPLPVGGAAPAATAVSDGAACLMASLLSESRIFALLHTGLAFRYARWQHTAALQAVLVGVAAARSAADGVCARAELAAHAGRLSARQVAALLTGMHLLPVPLVQPGNATSSLTACEGAGGGGASCASEAARLLLPEVPPHVDACRLLLFWAQICLGLVLPVWLGILSEGCARISFALQHPSEMSPAEKEQVLSAATSNDWMTAAVHLTLLWIALWHVLLAAAAAAGGAGVWAVSGGGTSAA
ncbi:gamma-tocopherol methyltransferase isoform A [Micractinium conductrix]|uniref:Gamma-tocopherol methyltransferase isoform A n=1 Tax=Micractinium conductrix TaxID=554055 RepID=A0A2P6V278_9CHLO|nr:gamma-tocopherol methyltransferase isoform A [Micractinium conductrix]|eukprot:PSC68197.1 gamma-tocopherol methyltransferase isoform A [Micractinium conductrix]